MARIPYVPENPAAPREIVEAMRARRGGTLLHLDRMLLHSPELAAGWNTYLGAVRTKLALSPKLRELAICVVAVLNDAEYEFLQHAPGFLEAGGTQAQLDALRDPDAALRDEARFDDTERAALAVAIASTRTVRVPGAQFDALARRLGERETVEFIATVATYNMVSRFLVALDIEPE